MTPEQRRLTALMFADIAGYSAMAERDERLALRLLDEHRLLFRPVLERYSGREVKSMADGFLAQFDSAVQAAACALQIQSELSKRNERVPLEERIFLRIGLHVGDVVLKDGDLLGQDVNLASRIQQLAEPGDICVSEDFARQVRRKLPAGLQSIGTPRLKNIRDPIEVFRMVAGPVSALATPLPARSLAVLPFVNMSSDPENEFFSDGLTEDIIARLSKIGALKVISRTSALQYKGTKKNLRTIGEELRVANILEGSVRRAANRVRINAQLIDAATDEHLWAETYDRELSDIFEMQRDVAEQIAQALEAKVTPAEQKRLRLAPTRNMEAYELCLRGRFFWNRRNEAGLNRSVECFQQALESDPAYAEAHAGLADAYTLLAVLEFLAPQVAFPKARAAAEKALELDPAAAEAHASLGLVRFMFDWNWPDAEKELRLATELNPNYAPGHHFYADFLKGMGRFEEAYREIRRAQELDPLSLAISSGVGHVLYLSRQYDRAIEAYRHTVELDPGFLQARLWFGRPYLQKGRYSEAIAELRQAVELSKGSTMSLAVLAHAHAASGDRAEALQLLETLQARAREEYVPSYWIAFVHVGFGDKDRAIEWMDKAREERSAWLAWANVEPRFDILRDDPRFRDILRKVGFPQPTTFHES
jgi:TolB-like protein/class 3 adenylate cyclase/Tfp pilus assembly protein PilF